MVSAHSPQNRQKALLADARKVYDEVVGIGYYRRENRRDYLRWLSNEIPGGERDSEQVPDRRSTKAPRRLQAAPADTGV
ncbi:hypothetical protein [Cupriavidus basilensis]